MAKSILQASLESPEKRRLADQAIAFARNACGITLDTTRPINSTLLSRDIKAAARTGDDVDPRLHLKAMLRSLGALE